MRSRIKILILTLAWLTFSVTFAHAKTEQDYIAQGKEDFKKGNYSQAVSDFSKAIETGPNAKNFTLRGLAYLRQGRFAQAIEDFDRAIAIKPSLDGYAWRGNAYFGLGDYKKAISDFTKAIELNPKYGGVYYDRAYVYYLMKDYDSAWADVHKLEAIGGWEMPNFITELKKASGRQN